MSPLSAPMRNPCGNVPALVRSAQRGCQEYIWMHGYWATRKPVRKGWRTMTEKWTPGPWKVFVFDPTNAKNPNIGLWTVEGLTNVANHCTMYDAHLIAAAPELYEALFEIANETIQDDCGEPDCPDCQPWRKAAAALAKARGEQ